MTNNLLSVINIKAYAGLSDPGLVRNKNEDNYALLPEQGLFFVADGVGGMPSGDIASMLVLEVLPSLIQQRLEQQRLFKHDEVIVCLRQAVIDLSNRLLAESQHHASYSGMASTLVLVQFLQDRLYVVHLGDSRAYLLKDKTLSQITCDHTLVRDLVQAGAITEEDALTHPGKNQLVQYMGMELAPNPDVNTLSIWSGEKILLCSDGLTDMLSEQEIAQILIDNPKPDKACQILIESANAAGGKDNVTAVIVDLKSG
ncbi:PP2C family protein-serine/threonine phosphatase [sulfur-oxidizing endosymbiont of Gigantopelta aegis]|uniref:PP2C family protein-serine/threonine phosphatase n=1 Tax=sulfur-oxidizing endosymbiont of Gigantopelta aegis TaxID=2794934 RepID=UPI0018DDFE39|nr:protein phosphatase 2C domain-containing protein [sulfur-oxidizing endosymbiont of Gigantopelta aegis]